MNSVAIIGGGFSGAMAAVNLARLAAGRSLRIALINDGHPMGRGVAYGTPRAEHLLNVAARNMSAAPDHPDHFVDWLRTRVEYSNLPETQLRETFAPRRVYGDYLQSLLMRYARPIDSHYSAEIELIDGEAIDVTPQDGGGAEVTIADGRTVTAERVLLATGNQPPASFDTDSGSDDHSAYVADPWSDWQERLPDPSDDVIVLGSGLSMVDAFLTLTELRWPGKIITVSRNGRIPHAHFRGIEYPDFLPAEPEKLSLTELVSLVEKNCEQLRQIGENPGIIVDRLRPHTQRIWQGLAIDEKREFLTRYAHHWNVVRHRIAQPIHQRLTEAIAAGQVQIVRGAAVGLTGCGDRLGVQIKSHSGEVTTREAGLVLNCTGPRADFSDSRTPLFANLLQRGLVRPDQLDMGIEVGPDFTVIGGDGSNSGFLFAIGPLMKGSLWETTAVPELRGQAMRVAEIILDAVDTKAGLDYRLSLEEEHVLEYYI